MRGNWTYHELFQATREMLRPVDGEQANFSAQQIVAAATARTPAQLVADYPLQVFQRDIDQVNALARRYLKGEPLAYILGQWEFHGLDLTVTPAVLIPRDDTEALCDLAIGKAMTLQQNPRILDLGAGSGCVGLAIAARVKDARVTLADISTEALKVARKNVQDNHLSGRVTCMELDMRCEPNKFLGKYDMIVSNPPYVTSAQMEELDRSVRDYEPRIALDGGPDGLDYYRAIVKNFTPILKPGGYICLEFGMGQEAEVCHILMENGYELGKLARDSGERARAVLARKLDREEDTEDGKEQASI